MRILSALFAEMIRSQRLVIALYVMSVVGLTLTVFGIQFTQSSGFNPMDGLYAYGLVTLVIAPIVSSRVYESYYGCNHHLFYRALPVEKTTQVAIELSALCMLIALPWLVVFPMFLLLTYLSAFFDVAGAIKVFFGYVVYFCGLMGFCLLTASLGRFRWYGYSTVLLLVLMAILDNSDISAHTLLFISPQGLYSSDLSQAGYAISGYVALLLVGIISFMLLNHDKQNPLARFVRAPSHLWIKTGLAIYIITGMITIADRHNDNDKSQQIYAGFDVQTSQHAASFRWAANTPITDSMKLQHQALIEPFFAFLKDFYASADKDMPALYIEHNDDMDRVSWHAEPYKYNEQMALSGNFKRLRTHRDQFYRDSLLEIIRMESNSWVLREEVAPYWRAVGALVNAVDPITLAQFKRDFPGVLQSIRQGHWLTVYFELGPCLFDRLMASLLNKTDFDENEKYMSQLLNQVLNVDGASLLVQSLRFYLYPDSELAQTFNARLYQQLEESETISRSIERPVLTVDWVEGLEGVYTPNINVDNFDPHRSIRVEFAKVEDNGWVNFHNNKLFPLKSGAHQSEYVVFPDDGTHVAVSWIDDHTGCRVYSQWSQLR